ncbi:MAG TPA: hypothetical protein VJN22_07695 [Candidatus Eremiobacteraceae bacterium]|nr:hypothetical protein [Candidatus Eremiobacteraceae bacterium]
MHLSAHSSATAIHAVAIPVEASVAPAAILSFEALAAIVALRPVVALKSFAALEAFR